MPLCALSPRMVICKTNAVGVGIVGSYCMLTVAQQAIEVRYHATP